MTESEFRAMLLYAQKESARKLILIYGEERLGPAEPFVTAALVSIQDGARLERMVSCAETATSWQEILATPSGRVMHEPHSYLMILEEGEAKATRENILTVGEERFGTAEDAVRTQMANVTDLPRLKRMHRRAVRAANWREILDTP